MRHATLTSTARAVARNMTYNDSSLESTAKHALRELAHRLDATDIKASHKGMSVVFINGLGKTRKATMKEWVLFAVFNVLPTRV